MSNTIIVRVDGGRIWGVSMGHLKRALILSRHLLRQNKVIFVMKDYSDGVCFARSNGMDVEVIRRNDDSHSTIYEICRKYRASKIIFDLYNGVLEDFFEHARIDGIKTIVFDVLGKLSGKPDILINDSLLANHDLYEGNGVTKFLLGPDYFIIDKSNPALKPRDKVEDVLVVMGGSDPTGMTANITEALIKTDSIKGINLNIVLGPCCGDQDRIRSLIEDRPHCRIYNNPPDFLGLLSKQDVIVTAAGRTLYECAALARPVIVVPTIEHEAEISAHFSNLTGCFDLGPWDKKASPGRLSSCLKEYRKSFSLRISVCRRGSRLFDGKGLPRVLGIINCH